MKVSKSNFRPPPKVESSIVRVEPRNPQPDINFIEWDGLLRICFSRKNKTLHAIFKNKSVIKLLFENFKLINQRKEKEAEEMEENNQKKKGKKGKKALESRLVDDEDEGDETNRTKKEKSRRRSKLTKPTKEFKAKIFEILEEAGFSKKRSRMMTCTDFLELLAAFNENGVHFK